MFVQPKEKSPWNAEAPEIQAMQFKRSASDPFSAPEPAISTTTRQDFFRPAPTGNEAGRRVGATREHALAGSGLFADAFDLLRCEFGHRRQATPLEALHRLLGKQPDLVKIGRRFMERSQCLNFVYLGHDVPLLPLRVSVLFPFR